jgi:hypothetical protein
VNEKWSDLSPGARRAIVSVAVVEGAIKVVALIDLARRPASQVRGSKAAWATAITLVNSAGVVPLVYFLRGRRA